MYKYLTVDLIVWSAEIRPWNHFLWFDYEQKQFLFISNKEEFFCQATDAQFLKTLKLYLLRFKFCDMSWFGPFKIVHSVVAHAVVPETFQLMSSKGIRFQKEQRHTKAKHRKYKLFIKVTVKYKRKQLTCLWNFFCYTVYLYLYIKSKMIQLRRNIFWYVRGVQSACAFQCCCWHSFKG